MIPEHDQHVRDWCDHVLSRAHWLRSRSRLIVGRRRRRELCRVCGGRCSRFVRGIVCDVCRLNVTRAVARVLHLLRGVNLMAPHAWEKCVKSSRRFARARRAR